MFLKQVLMYQNSYFNTRWQLPRLRTPSVPFLIMCIFLKSICQQIRIENIIKSVYFNDHKAVKVILQNVSFLLGKSGVLGKNLSIYVQLIKTRSKLTTKKSQKKRLQNIVYYLFLHLEITFISLYNKRQLSSTVKTRYTCRYNYRTMQKTPQNMLRPSDVSTKDKTLKTECSCEK